MCEYRRKCTMDNNDEDADSLDIKPPQMISSRYDKHKKSSSSSSRDKRHSREHRHKERSRKRNDRHSRPSNQARHSNVDSYEKYISSRDAHHKRNRKRYSPEKTDGERELEDLRSRLLSKRSKQIEEHQLNQRNGDSENSKYRMESVHDRNESYSEHKRRREQPQKNIIDLIDSPENYDDLDNEKYKSDKYKTVEDPELLKRRAKILDANREMARRKEVAREELEARRELHREKEYNKSPRLHKHHRSHKRKHHSPDKIVIESDEEKIDEKGRQPDSDRDNDDTASNSDSDTKSSKSDRSAKSDASEVPISPLSLGNLSKSERRRRHSQTRSRSPSTSRSHSKSRSTSRSRSKSRSSSRSSSSRRHSSRESDHGKDKNSPYTRRDRKASPVSESEDVAMKSERNAPEPEPIEIKEPTKEEIEDQLPAYYPGLQGCRSVEEFKCLNRIAEGTYGIVFRAQDKRTEEIVALKRLKMEKEKDGFPITSLREINTLLKGQHPNIVTVREIVVGSNMDKIFIVMDYVEHDFKTLMETMKHRNQSFLPAEVKCLTQQLLRAVAHLHDNWILHRDLKTSNLLLSHKGILKVGDFGLAREYGSPLKPYTSVVVTLWYRAPELLLCCKEYSTPIDMWSVGSIFAEFLQMCPLFPGQSETDQLNKIFKFLGTPNEKVWPGYNQLPAVQKIKFTEYPVSNVREKFGRRTSDLGLQLLQGMLTYDPKQRFTADQALRSNYFKELPLPIDPAMLPTWPAKSELGARKALASPPKPPSGGGQFKKLGASDVDENRGFILGANLDAKARHLAMGPGFSLKF